MAILKYGCVEAWSLFEADSQSIRTSVVRAAALRPEALPMRQPAGVDVANRRFDTRRPERMRFVRAASVKLAEASARAEELERLQ